jgi:hypothetical protein
VIQSNHLIGTLPAFALLLMMLIRKISNTNIRRGLLVFLVVNPLLLLITMFYSGNINPWFTFQETRRYNQCAATVIPTAYDQEAFPPGKTGCLPWQIPYLDLPQTPYYWRKTKGELSPSIGQEMGLVAESNSLLDDKSAINKDTFSITLQKIPTHGTLTFDDSERRRLRLFFIHQPGTLAVDLRGWPKVSSIFMENILSNQTGEQLSLPSGEISYIPSQNKDWNFRRKRLYFLQWLCPNLRGENFGYAFFILLLLGVFSATLKEKFHL